MVYDPMNDLLKTIDKQMEEKGIIAKDVPVKGIPVQIQNSIPKNPRGENSDLVPKSPSHNVREQKASKPKAKKLHDLDKYLIFAFTSLLIYTVISLYLFYKTGSEPAVLTGCFFAAFGGEILMCALIKRLKLHKEVKDNDKPGDIY